MIKKLSKSTGPKSLAGKRKSSMNALKSGIYAKTMVLPFEDAAVYQQHVRAVKTGVRAENPLEEILAQQAADAMWRAQRQEERLAWERKQIFQEMTATKLVAMVTKERYLIDSAPDFILDASHTFSEEDLVLYNKAYEQYLDFKSKALGRMENYKAVWHDYPELFQTFAGWVAPIDEVPFFTEDGSDWRMEWQRSYHALEKYLFQFAGWLWWVTTWEEHKPILMRAYANWYFEQGGEDYTLTQIDEAIFRERKLCQGTLETIAKLRRSQRDQFLWVSRIEDKPAILENEPSKNPEKTDD